MTVIDRAENKVGLLRQAVDLAERLREIEAERDRLLADRDSKCRELKAAGASIRELEEAFGVSRSRVQQILRHLAPPRRLTGSVSRAGEATAALE